ncbi:hypothetical protein [Bradyrhizobium sp. CCBAU 051011]|uniref:hypothetical protein n=1 Tax=Bradyrhizobium sp. CCBAU 051011 TaxID=858422 RepID=UPI0013793BDA|nr:hypothetical protein [Bradyrhizobium sp. CCBAU 051011]
MREASELNRERRLRRRLAIFSYRLLKTPARSALRRHQPVGYAVLHAVTNAQFLGHRFSATLEDVEQFANKLEQ